MAKRTQWPHLNKSVLSEEITLKPGTLHAHIYVVFLKERSNWVRELIPVYQGLWWGTWEEDGPICKGAAWGSLGMWTQFSFYCRCSFLEPYIAVRSGHLSTPTLPHVHLHKCIPEPQHVYSHEFLCATGEVRMIVTNDSFVLWVFSYLDRQPCYHWRRWIEGCVVPFFTFLCNLCVHRGDCMCLCVYVSVRVCSPMCSSRGKMVSLFRSSFFETGSLTETGTYHLG